MKCAHQHGVCPESGGSRTAADAPGFASMFRAGAIYECAIAIRGTKARCITVSSNDSVLIRGERDAGRLGSCAVFTSYALHIVGSR